MNIDEFCSSTGMPMPEDDVLLSAAYLESKGFKFMVDYDTDNVVDFAAQLIQRENEILNFSKAKKVCQSQESSSQPNAVLSLAIAGLNSAMHFDLPARKKQKSKVLTIRHTLARRRRFIGRCSL